MYYVLGVRDARVSEIERFTNSISAKDRNAVFIFIGPFCNSAWGYEILQWALRNVTPNGKYQAVLSKDGDTILKWYYKEYLPWYSSNRSAKEFPYVSKEDSYLLYHAKTLKHKEIVELAEFYESLPVAKEIHTSVSPYCKTYYCVESWLSEKILADLKKPSVDKNDLRCTKEFLLYYPPEDEEYMKWQGYYQIRPSYLNAHYNNGYTFNVLCTQGIRCFCIDTEKYIV